MRLRPPLLLAVTVVGLILATGANAAIPSFTWSAPIRVDTARPLSTRIQVNAIEGISCPSSSFCAADDSDGNILTTTTPQARRGWTRRHLGPSTRATVLEGIDCPSASFCAALDATGHVYTSTRPTEEVPSWRKVTLPGLPPGTRTTAISCPTPSFCTIVTDDGVVITSNFPRGGAAAWRAVAVSRSFPTGIAALQGLSCPSTTLCVAEGDGGVWATSTPARTAPWTLAALSPPGGFPTCSHCALSYGLTTPSCPSPQLCVTGDSLGNLFESTDATGGTAAWTGRATAVTSFLDLACPTTSLCVAGSDGGIATFDPGSNAPPTSVSLGPGRTLGPISCPTVTLCVGGADGAGTVLIGTAPA